MKEGDLSVLEQSLRSKISLGLLIALVLISVYFWRSIPGALADGVYTAAADSFGGELELAVTVEDGKMVAIEILTHNDTELVAAGAFAKLIPAIIEAQSPDVDGVSGATYTSDAVKNAVRQILAEN